jgi:hypothetical protein
MTARVKWYRPYDGRLAFEAHLQTPHFFLWCDATQNWITALSRQPPAPAGLTHHCGDTAHSRASALSRR